MSRTKQRVLTVNSGSSSIKFALYEIGSPLQQRLTGKIDRIGLSATGLVFNNTARDQQDSLGIGFCDYSSAANYLLDRLKQRLDFPLSAQSVIVWFTACVTPSHKLYFKLCWMNYIASVHTIRNICQLK